MLHVLRRRKRHFCLYCLAIGLGLRMTDATTSLEELEWLVYRAVEDLQPDLAENPSTRLMFLLDVVFCVQLWWLGEMINQRSVG
jgi:hypothetical protein